MGLTRRTGRSGMVLITTLLIMTFLVMLGTMLTFSASQSMKVSSNYHDRALALQAARSGLAYAMFQLRTNPRWDGGLAVAGSEVAATAFNATETAGVVIGRMNNQTGICEFKITFRPDNAGSGDDPMRYVSYNNMFGKSEHEVYLANEAATEYTTDLWRKVPNETTYIVVEGRAAPGQGASGSFYGVKKYVEAMVKIDNSQSTDAVAYAGGDILVNINISAQETNGKWTVDASKNSLAPKIRSNQNIAGTKTGDDRFYVNKGETYVGSSGSLTLNGNAQSASRNEVEIPRLTWSKVESECKPPGGSKTVRAGTYVWFETTPGNFTLKYFPMNLTKDAEGKNDTSQFKYEEGQEPDINLCPSLDVGEDAAGNPTITVKKPIEVLPGGTGIGTFAIVVKRHVEGETDLGVTSDVRPRVVLDVPRGREDTPVIYNALSADDDRNKDSIVIGGEMSGSGSVVGAGNIEFQGKSILSASKGSGVSVYAKGSINMRPIPGNANDPQPTFTFGADSYTANELIANAILQYYKPNQSTQTVRTNQLKSDITQILGTPPIDSNGNGSIGQKDQTLVQILSAEFKRDQIDAMVGSMLNKASGDVTFQLAVHGSEQVINVDVDEVTKVSQGITSTAQLSKSDQIFRGILYSWKDIKCSISTDAFSVTGSMVAYGNEVSDSSSPTSAGTIDISAGDVNMVYDPDFLGLLSGTTITLGKVFWSNF